MITMLVIQAIVVFVDASLITIDLLGLLQVKNTIHSFIYAVKLELEVLVLNQLVKISKLGLPGLPSTQKTIVAATPAAGPEQITVPALVVHDVEETYQEFAGRTRDFNWKPVSQTSRPHEDVKPAGLNFNQEVTALER